MTEQEQKELLEKFRADTAFLEAARNSKSTKELYDLFTKNGYTNLEYDAFERVLRKRMIEVLKANGKELTEEELEQVVGGSFWSDLGNSLKEIFTSIPLVDSTIDIAKKIGKLF